MGNIVKQILGGLWQVFTYRGGWVKPLNNSLPVASFLAIVAIIIKSLALFVSYLLDQRTPLAFAFSSVAVELVSMVLGIGLAVLMVQKRKLYPTMLGGVMYLAIISVFIGVIIGFLVSWGVSAFTLTAGQAQSLMAVIGFAYLVWFVSAVCTLFKNGLNEAWWRALLLTLMFMAVSHIVATLWHRAFFPQVF